MHLNSNGVRRWLAAILICSMLAACQHPSAPLLHDAYIWQRQWNPAVTSALTQSADAIRVWRVLAAQTDARGQLQPVTIDRTALAATHRPVVLVIRIDGQLPQWDADALLAQTLALRNAWSGVPLAGIEIDHDCGTARLPAYADFLARLKRALGTTPLSITALPAWLASDQLEDVTGQVDEVVLQVHAVQSPRAGLFDPALARSWIDRFAARAGKPFRVALPTYGSRVAWDDNGRVVAIESETPLLAGGTEASELVAAPAEVAKLLAGLRDDPPKGLAGIVWFRLPTTQDARAWSLPTWRAVMAGAPLKATLAVFFQPGAVAGAADIVLRNDGEVDARLPSRIDLPAACSIADGVNGYALGQQGGRPFLRRERDGWLRAHYQRAIGWARCGDASAQPTMEP
ncbi:DUF3142 domain-containing protein [Dyella sp. 2RAB6]|uniref:DUF3142 domain-containing protein n=1 Tax=Dyella sp. 2RAB6 TaxID=3232992 RepID=UPI003F919013